MIQRKDIEVEGEGNLKDYGKGNLVNKGNLEYDDDRELQVEDEGEGDLKIEELESNLIKLVSL